MPAFYADPDARRLNAIVIRRSIGLHPRMSLQATYAQAGEFGRLTSAAKRAPPLTGSRMARRFTLR
jgi:hypothetical protein